MPYVESIKVFVRVVELGSITAGGRDLRLTPAVASNRIKELEKRLGVRLFNRTTRKLQPTEVGQLFYDHARKVIETLADAEAVVARFSSQPRGTIHVTAPLGVGRRIIAPLVPKFNAQNPDVQIQLRLSDRKIDMVQDRIDVAFFLGELLDSTMKLRVIADCPRVLVAAPAYLAQHGVPQTPNDLLSGHNCLLLRYPRSPEYFWTLQTDEGAKKLGVSGHYDTDDGDVLTDWALAGYGIANKPLFDVTDHLASGALVKVLPNTPPLGSTFACLYPHRKLQDPKIRRFIDFVVDHSRKTFTP